MDAIQSEESHFVTWLAHMMAGNSGLVSWSLLKGELGINEERKMPDGKRKMKINKQGTVKADLDGSSFDLNHKNKILKSDWLSTALI